MSDAKPITPTTAEQIGGLLAGAADLAQMFVPQYAAYIVIGRAVAKYAPELVEDITKLLGKAEPTPEEEEALQQKLRLMANPETA